MWVDTKKMKIFIHVVIVFCGLFIDVFLSVLNFQTLLPARYRRSRMTPLIIQLVM